MSTPGIVRAVSAVALAASLSACGGATVEGKYVGQDDTFIDSLTFKSGGKVDVELVGVTHEGTYEIDGNSVTVVAPNGTKTPLTIASNGCLEGGGLVGTYCKDGSSASASSSGGSGGALSQVYEARAQEGHIRLEFGANNKVQLTMTPTGIADAPDRMSFDVGYEVSGDDITISLPGNEPLLLTRSGNDLEGTMNGETVRFVKR
jgi:hypothetical protein